MRTIVVGRAGDNDERARRDTMTADVRGERREAAARGRLKPVDPAKPEEGSGHIVLAMGKMGAGELNYSSDIDLIVFYDPDAPALADKDDATAFHVRIARGLVKLLYDKGMFDVSDASVVSGKLVELARANQRLFEEGGQ